MYGVVVCMRVYSCMCLYLYRRQMCVVWREQTHPNATPDLSFKILKQNNDVLRLHIEEALCIQTLSPLSTADKNTLELDFFDNTLLSVIPYSFFFSFFLAFTSMNTLSLCSRLTIHIYLRYKQTYTRIHTHTDYNPVHPVSPCSFIIPILPQQIFRTDDGVDVELSSLFYYLL